MIIKSDWLTKEPQKKKHNRDRDDHPKWLPVLKIVLVYPIYQYITLNSHKLKQPECMLHDYKYWSNAESKPCIEWESTLNYV